jgi:glycosyltransferase involved in cell wall biosynthesis
LAGQPAGTNPQLFPDIAGEITIHGIDAMVKRVTVSRTEAPAFYSAATVFVYPSLAEGFGLPPLEAMACGTPVIVSNTTSLPEVVGSAALSVAPDNVVAWRDALVTLLTDASTRQQLVAAGMHRASRFRYDTTAMQTVAVYAQVAARVL